MTKANDIEYYAHNGCFLRLYATNERASLEIFGDDSCGVELDAEQLRALASAAYQCAVELSKP